MYNERQQQQFIAAYIEAALWSSNDESDESGGKPMDETYSRRDLSVECEAKMKADCMKFMQDHADLLDTLSYPVRRDGYSDASLAGHDFWLTRNHHGVGFWDRDLGDLGDKLTGASQAFGETWLYIGDDGQVHT